MAAGYGDRTQGREPVWHYDGPMSVRRTHALVALLLLTTAACGERSAAGSSTRDNAYCQDGWTVLTTVVAAPDGTAWAGGSTCANDAEHSLLRRWDGSTWTDVTVEDVSEISDLEVDSGGTVWGLAAAPEPWRPGSALIRIQDGVASVTDRFDDKTSHLAVAPDGTKWISGSWRPQSEDGPAPDHPSPVVLREVNGAWEDTILPTVTTANGGNWTNPPTLLFLGDTPYAVGTAFREERPFTYLFRWNDSWKRVRIPHDLTVTAVGASTGTSLVFAGPEQAGPPSVVTFDGGHTWSSESIGGDATEALGYALAADETIVWVAGGDGEVNAPSPWVAVRLTSTWQSVPVDLEAGISLADMTVLPDGSALAVGANCCSGDQPRDAIAVHLTA